MYNIIASHGIREGTFLLKDKIFCGITLSIAHSSKKNALHET